MISSSYTFKNIKTEIQLALDYRYFTCLFIYRILITQLYNISKIQKNIFTTASKRDFENLFFLFKKFFKNCIIKLLKGGF